MAENQTTIAVFTKNTTNPAYEAARRGADQVARAAGARTIHFVPHKPDDVEEQAAMVEQAIALRPNAILFVPVHDTAMVEPVRRINDADIPTVLFINRIAGRFVSFVGSDDVAVGYKQTRALCEKLRGRGKLAMIEGVPAAPTSRDRIAGARRALAEFPDIELLASGVGNYQRADARRAMAAMLVEHHAIDGIIAANDLMALGAIEALRAASRRAQVVGVNAIVEAVRAIQCGDMLASVYFDAFKMACVAAQAALRHLAGNPVPPQVMLPAEIVDKTNCKAWLTPPAERTCPNWDHIVRPD